MNKLLINPLKRFTCFTFCLFLLLFRTSTNFSHEFQFFFPLKSCLNLLSDSNNIFFLLPFAGQNRTMLGSVASSNDLGAIPCAISWLYKGINEKRQKSGARFSVRVSALGINATKPGSSAKDLLAALATGNYLNVEK